MKYSHLIGKMKKYQEKIHKNIIDEYGIGEVPPDLVEKSIEADKWLEEANMRLGEAEVPVLTPDMDPIMDYANALILYNEMFSDKIRSEIAEFEELVDQLFTEVKGIPSH